MAPNPLFTIGHSDLSLKEFVSILQKNRIDVVADVRSHPYSKFNPDFNKKVFKESLAENGIRYVFLGKELGARRAEQECYINGSVSYALVEKTPAFASGIDRLLKGIQSMRVALLCAEKDPINCHRFVLVCHHLKHSVAKIHHIIGNDVESNENTEKRLLLKYKMANMELFRTDRDALEEAYRKHGEKIAYTTPEEGMEQAE